MPINELLWKSILNSLPESWLNRGSAKKAMPMASSKAMKANKIVSHKNCESSCFLLAPTTLRIPTSFALISDLAVVRLMKLKHAISKINSAVPANTYT